MPFDSFRQLNSQFIIFPFKVCSNNHRNSQKINIEPNSNFAANATSAVGPYTITPAPGTLAAGNYFFGTMTDGTLSVTKAPLIVTADAKSRAYGAANPAFTATVTAGIASSFIVCWTMGSKRDSIIWARPSGQAIPIMHPSHPAASSICIASLEANSRNI